MYTVVIVDDEEELRHAIINTVDWNAAGFEVIGDAENGVEALDLIEQLVPDLMITDIRMPLMTGLELAKNVRELCPATQMVILSGYDDFQYAQTAIQYNIISYLLKPISADELTAELGRIREKMDQRFNEIRNAGNPDLETVAKQLKITEFLLPLLLGNTEDTPDEEILNAKAAELQLFEQGDNSHYGVLVAKFKDSDGKSCTAESHIGFVNAVLRKYVRSESFFVNGRIVTLLIADSGDFCEQLQLPLRELVQSAARIFNQKCTIGISRDTDRLSLCGGAYFEAVTARRYTSDGAGAVRFIADQEHGDSCEFESIEKSVFTLEQLLKVGNENSLSEFFDRLYGEENRRGLDYLVIQILATVYRTVSAVSDKEALSELVAENPIYAKASLYDYEENVQTDLKRLCLDARGIISRYQKHDTEILCDRVIEIIEKEYAGEELSLTDVSARLNVSPNYLSALVKKTKGKNFITLLTEKRMKTAYDLLLCSGMKILEIAERCGYSDQHYFSYCFRKYYGVSPNKMRENNRS